MGERHDIAGCPGALDGLTILRFAHIFKNASGGMEQYLRSLNRVLLERNRMTVVQMHLVREGEPQEVQAEHLGAGTLLWVPSLLSESSSAAPSSGSFKVRVKRALYRAASATPPLAICLRSILSRGFLHYDATVSNRRLVGALDEERPDLVAFHWVSEDCHEVVQGARQRKIPFVVVNHFDNGRFNLPLMKTCLTHAAAYGGVSSAAVPRRLKGRFQNFSDGIDTDFFSPTGTPSHSAECVLLLPSRVTPRKGHSDLLRAAAILKKEGVTTKVVFAGREESAPFSAELRSVAAKLGLEEETVFTGHLCPTDLRKWYGASTLVVLPSHSEGLGRVLLEAQSMERVVLAYDVGGVSCAMQNGTTGFLIRKGDYRALARSAALLLSDPMKRAALGRNGRRFVQEHFSLPALAARHEAIYLAAMRPSHPRL